jgi:hypothetical protein
MVLVRPPVRLTTKNDSKKQFISSQAFHRTPVERIQETTAEKRFRPRILESFDPVAQEHYRDSTCNHPHKIRRSTTPIIERENLNQQELNQLAAQQPVAGSPGRMILLAQENSDRTKHVKRNP